MDYEEDFLVELFGEEDEFLTVNEEEEFLGFLAGDFAGGGDFWESGLL